MFNGIVESFVNLFFLKYHLNINFIFLRFNKKFYFINIGESISLEGICLTLIYKTFFYFEFEFSYETFLNISIFNKIFCNFEKSFNIFNILNGNIVYSHINNLIILKNKFLFLKIIKFYLFFFFFKEFFLYKSSLSINGVSLTLNEIFFFKNFFLISLNILNFSFFFTNFKFIKCYNFLNLEFDEFILFFIKQIFK